VGALDQLRGANGDNLIERARTNPRWAVAIAAGVVLFLAWIGWAIYVTSSNGATAGLGVVIAWPALLAALALISLPFIGGYLLIRRLSDGESDDATATAEAEEDDEEPDSDEDEEQAEEDSEDDSDDENEDSDEDESDEDESDEDESDEDESDEDESDEDSESDSEAEASSKKN
jgi:hypothetical protein